MSLPLSVAQLAYLAGVIDCRGHIELNDRHGHWQPRIRVTTRRLELLQHCATLTGTKVVSDTAGYQRRRCSEHCGSQHEHVFRQSAQWTVDSSRALIVLWNLHPYLVCQRDKASEAIERGLLRWPPAKGDTHRLMAGLGWHLPDLVAAGAGDSDSPCVRSTAEGGRHANQ